MVVGGAGQCFMLWTVEGVCGLLLSPTGVSNEPIMTDLRSWWRR